MGRKARQVYIPHKPLGRGATISKISDQESLVLRGWKDGSVFKKTGCSARIQVRLPGPHRWLTTASNFSSRGCDAFFWSPQARDTYVVHRHTCKQNTHTHKDRKKKTTLDVPEENLIPKESHARIRLKPASQTRNLSRRRGEQTVTLMPLVCYLSLSPWICLWVGGVTEPLCDHFE